MPWNLGMADSAPCVCDFDFDQHPVLPQTHTLRMAFRRFTMYQRILAPIGGSATSHGAGQQRRSDLARGPHARADGMPS